MSKYRVLNKLKGKTITRATFWPDEGQGATLHLDFTDGKFFCLTLPAPQLKYSLYLDDKEEWGNALVSDNRPLKKY